MSCTNTLTSITVKGSRLDYPYVSSYGPAKTTNVLRRVQNCATRLIMRSGRSLHMTHVLRKLRWLSLLIIR